MPKKRHQELTSESFEGLLTHLADSPSTYTPEELSLSLDHLFNPDSCTEFQIGAFLTLLRCYNLEGKPEMISIAASNMRERAIRIDLDDSNDGSNNNSSSSNGGWADLVGTGGDGKDTFNVSTTAALVAAGAGVKICKHGARASSSASGSADVLLALGIPITSLPLSRIPSIAQSLEFPFLFLFAPLCHPAMGLVAPIRKELGHPTIFNILGPLLNPARPDYMILGVHSYYLGLPFAEALKKLGVKRAWVVNGDEGLDEISPEGTTHIWSLENGQITERVISPETFGLPSHPLTSVAGGKPQENAQLILDLLEGKLDSGTNPIENFVVLNTAALLVVAGKALDEKDGVRLARESIKSGNGLKALFDYRDAAQKAMKEEEEDDSRNDM